MTDKDIEKMLNECGGLDMSHINKDDALAKARQQMYFSVESKEETEKKVQKGFFTALFTNKRFVSTLCGVALAFMLCFGAIGIYNENFQTVYIDINPSVALKLNRFERVIGVEFLNEDAKALLSDTKLVGSNAEDALKTVISACNSAGYVKEDSEIYISASAKQEQKSEKLLKKLKDKAETMRGEQDETYSVNTYNAKKDEKKDFEKESLSPAKYNIILDILDEDEGYRLDELKGKPMDELRKIKNRIDDDDDFELDDDDRGDDDDDDRNGKGNKNEKPEDKPNGKPEDKPNAKPNDMLDDKSNGDYDDYDDERDDERDDDDDDDDKNGKNHN